MMRDMTDRELELESLDLAHAELLALRREMDRDFNAVCAQLLEDAQRNVRQHEQWLLAGLVDETELASARRELLAVRQNIQLTRGGKTAHKRYDLMHCLQSRAVKMV